MHSKTTLTLRMISVKVIFHRVVNLLYIKVLLKQAKNKKKKVQIQSSNSSIESESVDHNESDDEF